VVFFLEEIVAVDRDHSGNIISFKTNTGRIISYRKAIQEIEQGKISGVMLKEQTFSDLPIVQNISTDDTYFENFPPIY
jgi:hypothetical protein